MEFDLIFPNTAQDWKDMATLFSEELYKVGVKVNLIPKDSRSMLESGHAHDFDMLFSSWGTSALPDDFTQIWHTSSWKNNGSNYSGFGTPESDALIDSIKTELNDTKRIQLSRKFQQVVYDDQPYIFLYTSLRRNIIHKRFGNLNLYSDRPGIMLNTLRLLSTANGITQTENPLPR